MPTGSPSNFEGCRGAQASDCRHRINRNRCRPVPRPCSGFLAGSHRRCRPGLTSQRPHRTAGARRPRRNAGRHHPLLHHLPQRAVADRRPDARPGRGGASGRAVRDVGEGAPAAARRHDAATRGGSSAAGVLHPRLRLPGARAGKERGGATEPRLAAAGSPADADRIRECDPRSAGAAGFAARARLRHAAAGRQREQRVRQPRRHAVCLAGHHGAVPGGRAQDQSRGGRRPGHRRAGEHPHHAGAAAAGRAPRATCRSARAAGWRSTATSRSMANTSSRSRPRTRRPTSTSWRSASTASARRSPRSRTLRGGRALRRPMQRPTRRRTRATSASLCRPVRAVSR